MLRSLMLTRMHKWNWYFGIALLCYLIMFASFLLDKGNWVAGVIIFSTSVTGWYSMRLGEELNEQRLRDKFKRLVILFLGQPSPGVVG